MGCNPGVIGFLHGRIRHPAQNAAYSFLHTNHEARDLNRSQWQAISTRAFNNCTTNTEKASGLNQTWVWTYTKIYFIMCSRFGEVCSWCISALLPGPAWVLLNYVLRRIIKPLYCCMTMRWKYCVCLPTVGEQNAIIPPNFTKHEAPRTKRLISAKYDVRTLPELKVT